ncbi:TerB family tellurite resistance protein [Pedobacter sp. BS3]|uniref:TerB family tellurite resistance protein n=1 Tax=Pedobacter sp. BS3 TaxID=2567937 RepID=UPI0011EFD8DC|nr:TerB family tellurite resistance protein [Pedobacter sp. BS3]TZF83903.1 TerB family tellurite resistance protein [Pedobacter sp. BS3]
MITLAELKNEILADGIIDANEVKELETVLFADGKIDEEEATLLFELNDAVSGKDNDSSWSDLFVKAISSYVLDDENSNGEIDEQEAKWLYDKIKGDGQIDDTERELLNYLKAKSNNFPEILEGLL